MQKYNDAMKTIRLRSLEKYTSHFIWKCCVWEGVGDRTELQHIDPHSYGHNSVSFPFSWAAQTRALGPSLSGTWSSFQHLLSNWSENLNSNCNFPNRGPEDPLCLVLGTGSLYRISTPTDLNFLSPGLYNNLTSTLLLASVTISHSIQPLDSQGHILIFLDRMHLLFTQVHFLFWQLGRVGGQYTTKISKYKVRSFVWVLWHINLCGLFNAKAIFVQISVQFQTIQFSMSTQFNWQEHWYFKLISLFKQFNLV